MRNAEVRVGLHHALDAVDRDQRTEVPADWIARRKPERRTYHLIPGTAFTFRKAGGVVSEIAQNPARVHAAEPRAALLAALTPLGEIRATPIPMARFIGGCSEAGAHDYASNRK